MNNSETAWVPAALMNTATGRKRRQIHVVPAATVHGGTAKAACRESPDPKFNGWNLQAVAHREVTCERCKLWAQLVSEVEAFSRRPEGWQGLSSVDVLDVAWSADSIDESDAIRWFVDFGDSACWTAQRAQRLSAWLANAENARSLIELQEITSRGNAQSCIIGAFLKFIGKLAAGTESVDAEVAKPAAKWLLEVLLACLAGTPHSSPWRPVELSQWLAADPRHDTTYTRLKEELQNKLELLFGQPHQRSRRR